MCFKMKWVPIQKYLMCLAFLLLVGCSIEPTKMQAMYGATIPTPADIEYIDDWLAQSIESTEEEFLAIGILLAESNDLEVSSTELLERAMKLDVSNASLIVSLLTHCNRTQKLSGCDLEKLGEKLIELDSKNAFPHVLTSLVLDEQGDIAGALEELEQAVAKEVFDDYFIDRSEFLANKLTEIDYPSEYLLNHSFFWAGDNLAPVYQRIVELCEKHIFSNPNWKNACIQLGELMEDHGRTFVAVRVGLGIQRSMYSFNPTDERSLSAVQRRRAFTHRWRVLLSKQYSQLLDSGNDQYFQDQFDVDEIYAVNQAFQRESGMPDPDSFLNRHGHKP